MHRLSALHYLLLLLATAATLTCGRAAPPAGLADSELDDLFQLVKTSVVEGTAETPVFFPRGMVIRDRLLYVTDSMGHTLTVFGLDDGTIYQMGGEGAGPGEFRMPGSLSIGKDGHIYVHDTGNSRVEILSQTGDLISLVPLSQRPLHVIPLDRDANKRLLLIGLRACEPRVNCRVTEVDMDGRILRQYAPQRERVKIMAFAAALDPDGKVYLANKLDDAIQVVGVDGNELLEIDVTSPATIPFDDGQPDDVPPDPYVISQHLREDTYTLIDSIHVVDDLILVQFRVANPPELHSEYILNAFSKEDYARQYTIGIPGRLLVDQDHYYFVTHDETSDYGRFVVHQYSMLPYEGARP